MPSLQIWGLSWRSANATGVGSILVQGDKYFCLPGLSEVELRDSINNVKFKENGK